MKKKFIILIIFFLNINVVSALEINSTNYIVFNLDNNQIIFSNEPDAIIRKASITKIMTTLVAIEQIDNLDERVTITYEMIAGFREANAALVGLRVGEVVTYRDLLYATFLASGAETSRALGILLAGSEAAFVEKMNDKARELGLYNTSYRNTTGLDAEGHVSTVREIAYLLKYAVENPLFKEIFLADYFVMSNGMTVHSTMRHTARSLNKDLSFIIGGRTGFTNGAGRCLASIAYDEVNSIRYLIVTVGADRSIEASHHIRDSYAIYNYLFENFQNHLVFSQGDLILNIDIKNSTESSRNFYFNKDFYHFYNNNFSNENVKIKFNGYELLTPRLSVGDVIGNVSVYYNDELIHEFEIILEEEIEFSLWSFIKNNRVITIIGLGCILMLTIILRLNKKNKKTFR